MTMTMTMTMAYSSDSDSDSVPALNVDEFINILGFENIEN
jgi:hypothetical protein